MWSHVTQSADRWKRIGFHMRDWWQPTKANFFGHLKKPNYRSPE
ncbi:putative parB-like nuclease [Escherichia coli 2722950]|nr:putative parB-like nuclease [Escherichia coli 2722950]